MTPPLPATAVVAPHVMHADGAHTIHDLDQIMSRVGPEVIARARATDEKLATATPSHVRSQIAAAVSDVFVEENEGVSFVDPTGELPVAVALPSVDRRIAQQVDFLRELNFTRQPFGRVVL